MDNQRIFILLVLLLLLLMLPMLLLPQFEKRCLVSSNFVAKCAKAAQTLGNVLDLLTMSKCSNENG